MALVGLIAGLVLGSFFGFAGAALGAALGLGLGLLMRRRTGVSDPPPPAPRYGEPQTAPPERANALSASPVAERADDAVVDARLTRERLDRIEERLARIERALDGLARRDPQGELADLLREGPPAGLPDSSAPFEQAPPTIGRGLPDDEASALRLEALDEARAALRAPASGEGVRAPNPAMTDTVDAPAPRSRPTAARDWIIGDNAMTRVGIVVLFFGIAFLLRYFAERFDVPIEARLAGVAAFGGVLIGLGLRLARQRAAYGLSLQGAGAGILYLTAFAAFRLYPVLDAVPGLILLIAITGGVVALAVRSASQPLAALAIAGGFLAPVLISRGGGEPVPLFTYFAILNAAIFALAWRYAWRALNVLGFAFTFVLAIVWGREYYRPEQFATVEPFLILFFGFYVAIAILYARREPLEAHAPVDAVLVFGVPLVGFALQAALLRDTRYGAAGSALALAGIYSALGLALWRRAEPGLALLARAFGLLALLFATIAIPFAFDARWTSAWWAVEAAGVYWLGCRQRQRWPRLFAVLLQLGAAGAFLLEGWPSRGDRMFLNASFAGTLLIALAAFATAYCGERARETLREGERRLLPWIFAFGALWWLGGGAVEPLRLARRVDAPNLVLGWFVASTALVLVLRRWLRWGRLIWVGAMLFPAMLVAGWRDLDLARTTLERGGWLVWPAAWLVHGWLLRAAEAPGLAGPADPGPSPRVLRDAHAASAIAFVAWISWEASEWIGRWTTDGTAWIACAAALPAIVYLAAVVRWRDSRRWPLATQAEAYTTSAGTTVAALLAVWFVMVNAISPGDPAPLPYLPLANPLDLTLAAAVGALLAWTSRFGRVSERVLYGLLGAAAFIALNGLVLRTGHHWGEIAWRLQDLLRSKPLQATLTLAWTATALPLMYWATRRAIRPLWMVGAALLAAVVAKLFLLDLGALSGLPRVVAFLGVGVLLLVIGYVAPLPPARAERGGA